MPRKGTVLSAAAADRQNAAIARWKVEHTDNLSVSLRKGKREAYKRLAELRGSSVSGMIQAYMDAECAKEGIPLTTE